MPTPAQRAFEVFGGELPKPLGNTHPRFDEFVASLDGPAMAGTTVVTFNYDMRSSRLIAIVVNWTDVRGNSHTSWSDLTHAPTNPT